MRKVFVVCMIAASCASKPAPVPPPAGAVRTTAELADRLGDSTETAVTVPADAPNDGLDFMKDWIYDRFGRFRRLKWGIAHAADRRYEVITVELPDQSQHTIYFDITENWNHWSPK
jgi:hypothetical protein